MWIANLSQSLIATTLCLALFIVVYLELATLCSYRKVGGMRFVRFGPLCFSFCLTSKPIVK